MKRLPSYALLLLLLALAGCGPKSYTLRLDPKQGETYTYVMKVTGTQNVEMTLTMKPTKVEANEVSMETKLGEMKLNGSPLPPQATAIFKDMVITVTEDRTGHVTDTQVTGVPAALATQMKSQSVGSSASFPDHPVKVGDTWTGETDVQGKKYNLTYKLAKVDTVSGKEAAILEATADASSGVKMDGPMTITIELATGMPLSTKANMEVNGQKSSMEMTRQ